MVLNLIHQRQISDYRFTVHFIHPCLNTVPSFQDICQYAKTEADDFDDFDNRDFYDKPTQERPPISSHT